MNSNRGLVFSIVAFVISMAAIGYLAWQNDQMARSLKRLGVAQEETAKTVKELTSRTDQNTRARQGVRMPEVQQWLRSIEKPLAEKAMELMRAEQKNQWEPKLKEWTDRIRQQDAQEWQKLNAVLAQDRQETRKRDQDAVQRYQQAEKRFQEQQKRWQELVSMLQSEQAGAKERYQQQEKQWSQLLSAVKRHSQSAEQQYKEVVQKLRDEKAEALARAKELEEERQREIGKLLDQANQISQERKRQLSEFCAKRPESVICRDL